MNNLFIKTRKMRLWIACALVLACFVTLSFQEVSSTAQIYASVLLLGSLLMLYRFKMQGLLRTAFLIGGVCIVLRYLFWRTFHTLAFGDPLVFTGSFALYLAEIYAITILFLGLFVNISPRNRRPIPLQGDSSEWPAVDVLIPTYNEEETLVETTLRAAIQIRYPKDKLRVCLCDDGGTDAKCEQSESARQRRESLQNLCARVGAVYLTRADNQHAKAGNLNSALQHTSGELVLVLDVDHMPTVNVLEDTVGWFQKDPQMAFVQTPHFFINPDPVEKNLGTFGMMPGETEMFYSVVQRGLDFWDASFFCGSAAVLKRKCLEKIGGLSGETITEDVETSLKLHSSGYHSAYLCWPMVAGLAPETFAGMVTQRVRWAQGMVQLLLLKNPLFLKGLTFPQRLGYFSSMLFWFFPFARLMFLMAPALYLLFGLTIYQASATEFLIYTLPYLVGIVLMANVMFGKVRWVFLSELYELTQTFSCIKAILGVFLNPKKPPFQVTPKGETIRDEFISPMVWPFYISAVIAGLCVVAGVVRMTESPETALGVMVCMGWVFLNSVWILGALGVLLEKRQLRSSPRMPLVYEVDIESGGQRWKGVSRDFSQGGCSILAEKMENPDWHNAVVRVADSEFEEPLEFHVEKVRGESTPHGCLLALKFNHTSEKECFQKVRLLMGDSARWKRLQSRREIQRGIREGLGILTRLSFLRAGDHFCHVVKTVIPKRVDVFRQKMYTLARRHV